MNMSLELSYDVDPLTNETFETPSFEVDPFTEDNYPVQMPAGRTVPTLINLTLNLKGSINSTLEIHGPGSFNGSKKESFSWTPQKSQTLTLTNTSEAIIGDLINVTLHDVEYDLNAELRYYYNSSGTVRNSSIVGNFTIPTDKNPSIVGTFKLEYPFPWRTAIWGGVAALGVSSFAFGVLCTVSKRELSHVQKRKTHAAALRVEHVVAVKTCSSCGTPNSAEAKFCKKCGMQL
jgi:ribosomal protein L40E